jgi:hypothetical protein
MKKATMEKVMVKEFVTHGHAYAICKDNDDCFWGFDLSELDENGCLAKEYNGITGHRNETMIETMRSCYQSARTDNEIDREKLKSNDMAELEKLLAIIEDSYIEIA